MTDPTFVDRNDNEFSRDEAIQELMRRTSNAEDRVAELSDLVNILIGRINSLETKINNCS